MKVTRFVTLIIIIAVIMATLTQEAEARRKILKGRKTITRTYYNKLALPAWAIVLLVGIGEIFIGGIAFLIMYYVMLKDRDTLSGDYSVATQHDLR